MSSGSSWTTCRRTFRATASRRFRRRMWINWQRMACDSRGLMRRRPFVRRSGRLSSRGCIKRQSEPTTIVADAASIGLRCLTEFALFHRFNQRFQVTQCLFKIDAFFLCCHRGYSGERRTVPELDTGVNRVRWICCLRNILQGFRCFRLFC